MAKWMVLSMLLCAVTAPQAHAQSRGQRRIPSCPAWSHAGPSPLDSVAITVGTGLVRVCYRPMAAGESGASGWQGLRPADAPTLHTSAAVSVLGLPLGPGDYALYPMPQSGRWMLAVLHIRDNTADVSDLSLDREVGRVPISAERMRSPANLLTVRAAEEAGNGILFLEWADTQLVIVLFGN